MRHDSGTGGCQRIMERVMGIEPTLRAWEAPVLPLNYTRTSARVEFAITMRGPRSPVDSPVAATTLIPTAASAKRAMPSVAS